MQADGVSDHVPDTLSLGAHPNDPGSNLDFFPLFYLIGFLFISNVNVLKINEDEEGYELKAKSQVN